MYWHTRSTRLRSLFVAVAALASTSLACGLAGGADPTPVPPTPTAIAATPTDVPAVATPTEVTAKPTEAPSATPAPVSDGRACFITSDDGQLHCVDSSGMTIYSEGDFPLAGDYANDITACGTGFAITYYEDVVLFDGESFKRIPVDLPEEAYGVDSVACDASGKTIAVTASGGFALLREGDTWTAFNMAEQDRDEDPEYTNVTDVAIAGDGALWVAMSNNLARWDGSAWQVFEKGTDWDETQYFSALAVAPDGEVYAAFDSGFMRYGGKLSRIENTEAGGAYALQVTQDHILVGHAFGAFLLDREGKTLQSYGAGEVEDLPFAATIYGVALDGEGRLWLGSTWGLQVVDEKGKFETYRMHNTDMTSSSLASLAIQGTPPLPPTVEHPAGSLTGQVLKDGKAFADAKVVACTIDFGSETPCSGDPNFVSAQTDADGVFTFADLPRGQYTVYVQVTAEDWTNLADKDGYYFGDILVDGSPVDVGEVGLYD